MIDDEFGIKEKSNIGNDSTSELNEEDNEDIDRCNDLERPRKIRRSRTTFTTYQLHQLERAFEKVSMLKVMPFIILNSFWISDAISWCLHTRRISSKIRFEWSTSPGMSMFIQFGNSVHNVHPINTNN